jgi:hypothetical protein
MNTHGWIYAAAGYNVALALFHLGFWRMFRWSEELPKLHPANRGVMQVINIMLTFVFLSWAGMQLLLADEMANTALGRALLAGIMFFWILRAALQPVFWRSQPKAVNGAFVFLFMIGAGLHALAFNPA